MMVSIKWQPCYQRMASVSFLFFLEGSGGVTKRKGFHQLETQNISSPLYNYMSIVNH